MAAVRSWLHAVENRTLVWLARSHMSSVVIAGTLAAAGLGAAALSVQSSTATQQKAPVVAAAPVSMSMSMAHGCPHMDGGSGYAGYGQ